MDCEPSGELAQEAAAMDLSAGALRDAYVAADVPGGDGSGSYRAVQGTYAQGREIGGGVMGLLLILGVIFLSGMAVSLHDRIFGYDKDDEYVDDSYLDRLDYDDWSGRD